MAREIDTDVVTVKALCPDTKQRYSCALLVSCTSAVIVRVIRPCGPFCNVCWRVTVLLFLNFLSFRVYVWVTDTRRALYI
jgi:hypothetical protein